MKERVAIYQLIFLRVLKCLLETVVKNGLRKWGYSCRQPLHSQSLHGLSLSRAHKPLVPTVTVRRENSHINSHSTVLFITRQLLIRNTNLPFLEWLVNVLFTLIQIPQGKSWKPHTEFRSADWWGRIKISDYGQYCTVQGNYVGDMIDDTLGDFRRKDSVTAETFRNDSGQCLTLSYSSELQGKP